MAISGLFLEMAKFGLTCYTENVDSNDDTFVAALRERAKSLATELARIEGLKREYSRVVDLINLVEGRLAGDREDSRIQPEAEDENIDHLVMSEVRKLLLDKFGGAASVAQLYSALSEDVRSKLPGKSGKVGVESLRYRIKRDSESHQLRYDKGEVKLYHHKPEVRESLEGVLEALESGAATNAFLIDNSAIATGNAFRPYTAEASSAFGDVFGAFAIPKSSLSLGETLRSIGALSTDALSSSSSTIEAMKAAALATSGLEATRAWSALSSAVETSPSIAEALKAATLANSPGLEATKAWNALNSLTTSPGLAEALKASRAVSSMATSPELIRALKASKALAATSSPTARDVMKATPVSAPLSEKKR